MTRTKKMKKYQMILCHRISSIVSRYCQNERTIDVIASKRLNERLTFQFWSGSSRPIATDTIKDTQQCHVLMWVNIRSLSAHYSGKKWSITLTKREQQWWRTGLFLEAMTKVYLKFNMELEGYFLWWTN